MHGYLTLSADVEIKKNTFTENKKMKNCHKWIKNNKMDDTVFYVFATSCQHFCTCLVSSRTK